MGLFGRKKKKKYFEINPDEIFLDAHNSMEFNQQQMEGQIERPISKTAGHFVIGFIVVIVVVFVGRLFVLQVRDGDRYEGLAIRNSLKGILVFADRGVIFDRNGVELAWNEQDTTGVYEYPLRRYTPLLGFSHMLGYVGYPTKDIFGNYWQTEYIGESGVEKIYNDIIRGENGSKLTERDARGEVLTENIVVPAQSGRNLYLSIDARLQNTLATSIQNLSDNMGYRGGAAAIMDLESGELLAMVSYPEFNSSVLTDGDDKETISSYVDDPRKPYLNRLVQGLYSPGSTVKPFIALGALTEGVIGENDLIYSDGGITIQSPYDPNVVSRFRDWKEGGHGMVDVRKAIAESVNTYFYSIGGGYGKQKGIGIKKIEYYSRIFGIGSLTGIAFSGEQEGNIPNPEWKAKLFDGDVWRVGDTYNTSIGQYGFQATPLQMLRAVSSLANGGTLLTPHVIRDDQTKEIFPKSSLPIVFKEEHMQAVKEGMRQVVTSGTGQLMNVSYVDVAAKTGTAQAGLNNRYINSWVIGFFPYEKPKYGFVVLMEQGPREAGVSASFVMRQLFDYMNQNTPEYFIYEKE